MKKYQEGLCNVKKLKIIEGREEGISESQAEKLMPNLAEEEPQKVSEINCNTCLVERWAPVTWRETTDGWSAMPAESRNSKTPAAQLRRKWRRRRESHWRRCSYVWRREATKRAANETASGG